MVEKRLHPRAPLVAKVETSAEGFSFLAVAGDVSEGGMLINTANPCPVGEVVSLQFILPATEKLISVEGRVLRVVENTSMAVAFNELRPEDRAYIREYVEAKTAG